MTHSRHLFAVLVTPLFMQLAGIILASVSWDSIIESMFRDTTVSGLTIVLHSGPDAISYFAEKGKVIFS